MLQWIQVQERIVTFMRRTLTHQRKQQTGAVVLPMQSQIQAAQAKQLKKQRDHPLKNPRLIRIRNIQRHIRKRFQSSNNHKRKRSRNLDINTLHSKSQQQQLVQALKMIVSSKLRKQSLRMGTSRRKTCRQHHFPPRKQSLRMRTIRRKTSHQHPFPPGSKA